MHQLEQELQQCKNEMKLIQQQHKEVSVQIISLPWQRQLRQAINMTRKAKLLPWRLWRSVTKCQLC